MNLNLSGQIALCNEIRPEFVKFKNSMDKRISIWNKLDNKDKKRWIEWDKDPIMGLADDIIKYFVINFPDLVAHYAEKHSNDTP